MSSHSLPKLPYSYDALAPYIDARTMEIHHTKHHQAYVTSLVNALEKAPRLQTVPLERLLTDLASVPPEIRTTVRHSGGGHFNHSFFWPLMDRQQGGRPRGDIGAAITDVFQTFENFKDHFTSAALGQFGSGWAWLSLDRDGKLTVHATPNQDSPIMEGWIPVLGLDVWEHAYYLTYENRRADYIEAWWNVIDWNAVEDRFHDAVARR